jgi:hypothetical protein
VPLLYVFFVLIVAFGSYFYFPQQDQVARAETSQSNEWAQSMRVYGSFVAAFHRANASFSGQVDDSLLGLPAWFKKSTQLANILIGGRAFVYIVRPDNLPRTDGFFNAAGNSPRFGIAKGGSVVSPSLGTVLVVIPSLPDGTLVLEP